MKRLTLLAFVLSLIGATSCKKGDDPIPATQTNIPVTQQPNEWEVQTNIIKVKKPSIKPKPEEESNGGN